MIAYYFPILAYIAAGIAALYPLWVFYLAVMNLKRARDAGKLSKPAAFFGKPVLLIGYALDAFTNVVGFTVLMLDMPQELTVTARLTRYARGEDGWRKRFALWFADQLLDDFDPSGQHIKP